MSIIVIISVGDNRMRYEFDNTEEATKLCDLVMSNGDENTQISMWIDKCTAVR